MIDTTRPYDLLIIGGGINGVGIARDAAGRGLKVLLCEQHDLAQHTSSASSKLVHGGLRYLEHFEFRLVRESLGEREVLLNAAPHIVHPMRFVMPHVPALRPAWMIRIGLFLYDYLARRDTLADSQAIDLRKPPYNHGLQAGLSKGFIYSDCWVDDSRLVIANARAAADLGATILPRTSFVGAERVGAHWQVRLQNSNGACEQLLCRTLINTAGPWSDKIINKIKYLRGAVKLRLVQGSHIIVPRIYDGEHAFILQNDDQRVIFVYPYEEHYTLIGTTDVAYRGDPGKCTASAMEIEYLCRAANRYFEGAIRATDVVWSYCGVRPLVDDGTSNVSEITRDYTLRIDGDAGTPPLLSVFGGKITTYRKLAEQVLEQLKPWFPNLTGSWTAKVPLPGGDLHGRTRQQYVAQLSAEHPAMPQALLQALVSRHGSLAPKVLGQAQTPAELGAHFGHTLYAREVDYCMNHEWARNAEDILWRRSKCGLHINSQQKQKLVDYVTMAAQRVVG